MAVSEYLVEKGDNIWNIAADTLATGDYQPTLQEIVVKMEELIKLNLDTLKASPGKGNPDLIYPGMRLRLTPVISPGAAAEKGKDKGGTAGGGTAGGGTGDQQRGVDDGATLPPGTTGGGGSKDRNLSDERDARLKGATVPPEDGVPATQRNLSDERDARLKGATVPPEDGTPTVKYRPSRNLSDERDARLNGVAPPPVDIRPYAPPPALRPGQGQVVTPSPWAESEGVPPAGYGPTRPPVMRPDRNLTAEREARTGRSQLPRATQRPPAFRGVQATQRPAPFREWTR